MIPETYLFIGGCADGKRITVNDNHPTVMMAVLAKFDYTSSAAAEVAHSEVRQEYQKAKLRSGDNFYWVFTCGDPDNVIADLIDGYSANPN